MPPQAARPIANTRKHITALIYGWPGSWKTPLIGTCTGKVLIAECDPDGTASLAGSGRKDIDVVEVYDRRSLSELVEYVRHEGHKEYDWFWIDSASGLEGRLMADIMLEAYTAKPDRQSRYIPDKPHYQLVQNFLDNHIKWVMEAPIHFGLTAHVMIQNHRELDEEGNDELVPMYMPQIQGGQGKLSQKICGYFSILGFMETQAVTVKGRKINKRVMLVNQDTTHQARDRYHVLAPATGKVIDPNMAEIERKVMAKMNGQRPLKKVGAATKVAGKRTAKKTTTKKVGRK